jgi:hypothetical protein
MEKSACHPHSNGGWQVKGADNSCATARTKTQAEAIDIARIISNNQDFKLIICRPNGQIRAKDSHGNDPYSPQIKCTQTVPITN